MSSRSPSTAQMSFATTLNQLPAWQGRVLLLLLAAGITLLLRAVLPNAFHALEEQAGGFGWQWNPATQPEQRFSIVGIDEKSLQEVGAWPWPRETMAKLSEQLMSAGVQVQLYDIYNPESRAGDAEFAAALQRGNGVLAQVPDLQNTLDDTRMGQLDHPVTGVDCKNTAQASNYRGNAAAFADVAKGHIAYWRDNDGAVRSLPAAVCVDGQAYPSLAISGLLQVSSTSRWQVATKAGDSQFGPDQVMTLPYSGHAIPLDQHGNMRVSYRNSPDVYRTISAADILAGRADTSLLEGSLVLVGLTASGLPTDVVPTPFDGATPGVEVQARILGSILDGDVPYTPKAAAWMLAAVAVVFALLLGFMAGAREKVASYGLSISVLLLPVLALGLHVALLKTSNMWIGWLAPALYGSVAASLLLMLEFARVKLERARVLDNLSSYLPQEVAAEIAYSLPNSAINAQRKNVTLMCADLRNFSAYGESRPPEESAALLHFFFTRTTAVIEKFHGRVHEFKGDSLLAIWDGSDAGSASAALQAAHELQHVMGDVLPQHPPAGLEPLALGIGIEQGPVLIGSIGPAHRRTHTLLGETVTITLRIQEMTADLAQPILVGECAARQLSEHGLISQGSYLLNGLRNPHILYAPPQRDTSHPSARTDAPPLRLLRGGRS